jgi:hypothetical protein
MGIKTVMLVQTLFCFKGFLGVFHDRKSIPGKTRPAKEFRQLSPSGWSGTGKKKLIRTVAGRIIARRLPVKGKLVDGAPGLQTETADNSRLSCVLVNGKYI